MTLEICTNKVSTWGFQLAGIKVILFFFFAFPFVEVPEVVNLSQNPMLLYRYLGKVAQASNSWSDIMLLDGFCVHIHKNVKWSMQQNGLYFSSAFYSTDKECVEVCLCWNCILSYGDLWEVIIFQLFLDFGKLKKLC